MEETPKTKCSGADTISTTTQPQSWSSKKRRLKVRERKAASFTQKQQIIMLMEYQRYRSKFGNKNDWERFHEMSELKETYSRTQLSEKIRRLKERFFYTNTASSPPADPRDARIFELCKSLWGDSATATATATTTLADDHGKGINVSDPKQVLPNFQDFLRLASFLGDSNVPEILRSNWGLMGREAALGFERRWIALTEKEVCLSYEKLILKAQVCQMVSKIINPPSGIFLPSSTQSSSCYH